MNKLCPDCNTEMKRAFVRTGSAFVLEEMKKGLGAKVSTIDAYVCPDCGHIDWVAENPEIFCSES